MYLDRLTPQGLLVINIANRHLDLRPVLRAHVHDLGLRAVEIARTGLAARKCLDRTGNDETGFVNVLQERASRGRTPADYLLEDFAGKWGGNIDRLFDDCAY